MPISKSSWLISVNETNYGEKCKLSQKGMTMCSKVLAPHVPQITPSYTHKPFVFTTSGKSINQVCIVPRIDTTRYARPFHRLELPWTWSPIHKTSLLFCIISSFVLEYVFFILYYIERCLLSKFSQSFNYIYKLIAHTKNIQGRHKYANSINLMETTIQHNMDSKEEAYYSHICSLCTKL